MSWRPSHPLDPNPTLGYFPLLDKLNSVLVLATVYPAVITYTVIRRLLTKSDLSLAEDVGLSIRRK